jgi:hypothetical protein
MPMRRKGSQFVKGVDPDKGRPASMMGSWEQVFVAPSN